MLFAGVCHNRWYRMAHSFRMLDKQISGLLTVQASAAAGTRTSPIINNKLSTEQTDLLPNTHPSRNLRDAGAAALMSCHSGGFRVREAARSSDGSAVVRRGYRFALEVAPALHTLSVRGKIFIFRRRQRSNLKTAECRVSDSQLSL